MLNTNGFDFVDLGLPSGTLWATMNVGASNPSDFGLYFQWGDVQGYTAEQVGKDKQFNWNDYKFSINGSEDEDNLTFTKYITTGATLELADDAAHFHMGGSWHMPSSEQIQELINETTSNWIKLDGVNGRLFTSKNGKSIFIPAAGYASNGSVYVSGSYGLVWASMLDTDGVRYGQYLNFDSSYINLYNYSRYNGLSVRGVIG